MKQLFYSLLFVAGTASAQFQYLSPMPGAQFVNPSQTIIIREGSHLNKAGIDKSFFTVEGNQSGLHDFRMVHSSDCKTIILHMDNPFAYSENVTVTIAPGMPSASGKLLAGQQFSFSTHREYTAAEKQQFLQLKQQFWADEVAKAKQHYAEKDPDVEEPKSKGALNRELLGSFTVLTNNGATPGEVFYDAWNSSFFGSTKYDGYNIITPDGDSVWASAKFSTCFDFTINPNGYLSVYNSNNGRFDVLDSNYVVIDNYYPGNNRTADPHEFTIYTDGHAFMVAEEFNILDLSVYGQNYNDNANCMTTIIQEFDADKNVIFEWRSIDHVIPTESNQNLSSGYVDVVHTNSIDLDADGNIIASHRHLNQVTKIDRSTGNFIWRLGGVENEFNFLDDPDKFTYQHDARRTSTGTITLWDNGNSHVPTKSWAKEYMLDEVNMTADLVWSFNPPTYSGGSGYWFAMGSARRLDSGNTLIAGGWDFSSNQSNLFEVTPAGDIVWEVQFANTQSLVGYRAAKFNWKPCAMVDANSITVQNITQTTAKLNWNDVPDAVYYYVKYKRTVQNNWKTKKANQSQVTLKNLFANTEYQYQIYAVCMNGYESDLSPLATFTTLPLKLYLQMAQPVFAFELAPNPAGESVTIQLQSPAIGDLNCRIYDITGALQFEKIWNEDVNDPVLDVSKLPAGMYLVEVTSASGKATKQLVIE